MRIGIHLLLFTCLGWLTGIGDAYAQTSATSADQVQFPAASQFSGSKLTYKIISAEKKTYCYDIFADGRLLIHQPSAPGLPGNKGFKSKGDATKVAQLVIEKIKKGEMPPSVTKDELKTLGVL
jgi:hypothetical protein